MPHSPGRKRLFCSLIAVCCTLCECESRTARTPNAIPQATVQHGDLQVRIVAAGLLKSEHIYPITAPPVGGAMLQILHLPHTGTAVSRGDVVLEFDVSQQQYNLDQSRNDLAQAEQEIVEAKADTEVQVAQDKADLLKARFAVRKAELDVGKNEILSDIEAKKNVLALEEARRALLQLETDIQSHASSNRAGLLVSQEKQNKARLTMKQAQENIDAMKLKAPASGILVVHGNETATGGMFFSGMMLPDYQPGDQVGPGSTVADVIDTGEMEIDAQVDETERPLLTSGQPAEVQIDAIPGETFAGKLADITGAVNQEFWRASAHSKFGVTVKLDHADLRLRPGFTARIVLIGEHLSNVDWVPRQAIFDSGERKIIYLKQRGSWEQREVKIRTYSEGRAVVDGASAGALVALTNPQNGSRQTDKRQNESVPPVSPSN